MNEPPFTPPVSCDSDFDPESLDVEEARQRILNALEPLPETELVPLAAALGRVTGAELHAKVNVPSATNAAVDGYALRGAELPQQGTRELRVAGVAFAGHPFQGTLGAGDCVRIMTGAALPEETDTVVMQEHVQGTAERIRLDAHGLQTGANVRQAGEDIQVGERVLERGQRLRAVDLGLAASVGAARLLVTRKLKVAFFSTGDELCPVDKGELPAPGMIYDSNRYSLHGLLGRSDLEVRDYGIARDEPTALERLLREAAAEADVVLTSGGVSVGEADLVRETLSRLGSVSFWKVAMKPGRPLAFGHIGQACFFGLPGNPVSVLVTFHQFVLPALRRLAGEQYKEALLLRVPCVTPLRKRPGRVEYQRGVLRRGPDGDLTVAKTGAQGSGILRSMGKADCYIILGMEQGEVRAGDLVEVQLFSMF